MGKITKIPLLRVKSKNLGKIGRSKDKRFLLILEVYFNTCMSRLAHLERKCTALHTFNDKIVLKTVLRKQSRLRVFIDM